MLPPTVVQDASLEDLTGFLDRFMRVQSLKAVVDLQLTYVTEDKTKERILTDVRGAILAERPDSIRVNAKLPVTRTSAFDMASFKGMFQVYLSLQNRFFEGSTASKARSEKRSENIRPQHIFEPLLVAPFAADSIRVLDPIREGRTQYYVIDEILRNGDDYRIGRKFWFNREDLKLSRLEIRGDDGELLTTARYQEWSDYGEDIFPGIVTIDRPVDGYTLKITFLKPGINEAPPADAFVLEPPDGVKVEHIEEVPTAVKTNNRSS